MPGIGGLASRLNKVQKETGHGGSMRAFRDALLERDFWRAQKLPRPSFSQEAMRRYHLGQDPPTSYVSAVVTRFQVNPAWLVTGEPEGQVFMEDVRRAQAASMRTSDHALWPPALAGAPELSNWPAPARFLFLDLLHHYAMSFRGWYEDVVDKLSPERRFEAIAALAADLYGMVNVEYHSMRTGLTQRDFGQYLIAMLHAVQLRIPDVEQGPHIYYRFPTLSPKYRALHGDEEADRRIARPLSEVEPSMWSWMEYADGASDASAD